MLELLEVILTNPVVQSALVAVLVAVIAYVAKKKTIAKKIALFAADAYEFAEEKGYVQNLKGYAKFDPFMDMFIELVRNEFGRAPTPAEKGQAVEVMEGLVLQEPGK